MKSNKYFDYVQINQEVITNFVNLHPEFKPFVSVTTPFSVRIMPNLYACLVHSIISQDQDSKQINECWQQLGLLLKNKFVPRKFIFLNDKQLQTCNLSEKKLALLKKVSIDCLIKKINLKKIKKMSTSDATAILSKYEGLTPGAIETFLLFGCFKQDILCISEPDFIKGWNLVYKLDSKTVDRQEITKSFTTNCSLLSIICFYIANNLI